MKYWGKLVGIAGMAALVGCGKTVENNMSLREAYEIPNNEIVNEEMKKYHAHNRFMKNPEFLVTEEEFIIGKDKYIFSFREENDGRDHILNAKKITRGNKIELKYQFIDYGGDFTLDEIVDLNKKIDGEYRKYSIDSPNPQVVNLIKLYQPRYNRFMNAIGDRNKSKIRRF